MNYISQVIRSQRVKKSLTLINITGLSVCIAAALLIMLHFMIPTVCIVLKADCMRARC